MKWKPKKNTKYQWNKNFNLWKVKQDWLTLKQTNQKKEGEDPNKKIRDEKGYVQQTPLKFRESSGEYFENLY
jgi:hypothetical protein